MRFVSYTAEHTVYLFPAFVSYARMAPEDVGGIDGAFDFEAGDGYIRLVMASKRGFGMNKLQMKGTGLGRYTYSLS